MKMGILFGGKNMKIRRNEEGNMLFIDAMELLSICVDNGVLQGERNRQGKVTHVFVYHEAGTEMPEGWYKHEIEELAMDVMRKDEVINLLAGELINKTGTEFKPSFDLEFFDWCKDNVFPFVQTCRG